ncbi:MAG: 2-isopropylmalate synthase, partial [Laribacter sp.]|nr:2-isopropylmalate synthase [Laribacter sp.]
MQLDIDRLIRDFGGVTALADALTFAYPADPVSRAAVYKWRARGSLPLSQLQKLTRIAADRGW